jgi:hypothetical protein
MAQLSTTLLAAFLFPAILGMLSGVTYFVNLREKSSSAITPHALLIRAAVWCGLTFVTTAVGSAFRRSTAERVAPWVDWEKPKQRQSVRLSLSPFFSLAKSLSFFTLIHTTHPSLGRVLLRAGI